ncbi:acid proteinase [Microthyrium microscopicum]|uniref:Acid proteinase n=1 Tax=Microthyrium microscopicum TaxID=703497 RepID=A0A6A6UNR6_9PEZI|nr:acid proteinase [Microthyrium microscopicum]
MKTSTILTTLLATTALAAPFTSHRRARRDAQRTRRSLPRQNATMIQSTDGSNIDYDSNWAGAVLIGSGYTSVTGTITVPVPSAPSGGSRNTEYSASAWVGIDGDTCQSAILQTGVDFYVQNGKTSYDAWYEWYPDYSYTFDGFAVNAGDSISMTVTSAGTSGGSAVITNHGTGKTVTHTFTGQQGALCNTNAEWIVEDFSSGDSLVPFADFDAVTFTGASAVSNGQTVDVDGSTIVDIRQNNQVLTDCSAGGSSVTCSYT